MKIKLLILSVAIIIISSVSINILNCKGEAMDKEVDFSDLRVVPQAKWDALANKKIYFGHQSVGYNIIDGIKDVMTEMPNIKLDIVETKNPEDFDKGIFAHSSVGRNENPKSKIDDFKKIMDSGVGGKVDIAFFKFCYIDINSETDQAELLAYYKKTMNYLEQKYPNTKFVHFTVPIRTTNNSFKANIRRFLKKDVWGDKENIARNKYNKILMDEYVPNEDLFNIALYEATLPDNSLNYCADRGDDYLALWSGYSEDGGHLSLLGKKYIAQKLLLFLIGLEV
ncbi:MAG: hypothetical protein KJ915_04085 [Candidatus Omnitrophica bacterium]|nr:hypothetical protein [Candidatus Omnitrophota bacterium]